MTTNHVDEPELAEALSGLAATAPPTLAPSVLVEVGLADRYAPIDSPVGTLWVAWNGRGVSEVTLATDDPGAFQARHLAQTGRTAMPADAPPDRLRRAIERRLSGDRAAPIPLDLRGHSSFEQEVWRKALEIPRGQVRPYGWVASEIGRPRAVRAVGTALGHNPVPLIVPCHRVVRTDGMLGQYSLGGPRNKRSLLAWEGLDPEEYERQARAGIRFLGSDTTHIVCLPSCADARRTTERHRVTFRSLAEARDAGYRPCRHCRPGSASVAA